MKNFDEKKFRSTLAENHWDSVFVFDDIDDISFALGSPCSQKLLICIVLGGKNV